MKTRHRLEAGRAESERQKQRIQDQRDQTQLKLDQVKAKLTRDGAFERKRYCGIDLPSEDALLPVSMPALVTNNFFFFPCHEQATQRIYVKRFS